ncbi:MAG: DMT family transporter [Erythrobacter sp.]
MTARSLLVMMLCNIVWALNVVVSKIAVDDLAVPPLFYAVLRSGIVAVVLLPLLRPVPPQVGKILLAGLAIGGGSFALFFMGLKTASPSASGVVSLTAAPMTVLFAIIFLGERIRWRRGLGIFLAFGGVFFAMTGASQLEASSGLLLVFISAVVGALGAVFVKRLEVSSIRLQAWAAVSSVLVLLPVSALLEQDLWSPVLGAPWGVAACLFFAAIVVSIGAHTAYFKLLQEHDTNVIVPLTLFTPILTIVFGAWLTGDAIGGRLVVGGAIALVGVAIITLRPSETFTRRFLLRPRL